MDNDDLQGRCSPAFSRLFLPPGSRYRKVKEEFARHTKEANKRRTKRMVSRVGMRFKRMSMAGKAEEGQGDVSAGMAELVKVARGKTCLVVLVGNINSIVQTRVLLQSKAAPAARTTCGTARTRVLMTALTTQPTAK